MKRSLRRLLPCLETLEERCTPASVHLLPGGLLVISNPVLVAGASSTLLTQTASDAFTVRNPSTSTSPISYSNVNSIIYSGSNVADTLTVNLGGFSYTGSLTASTGNGNDVVTIGGATGSSINGNILISEGLSTTPSNDTLNLNSTGTTGAVTFGGSIVALHGSGAATFNLGNATATRTTQVNGSLTLNGYTTINLGGGTTSTVAATVGGGLTIQDGSETRAVTIGTNSGFSVHGNLSATTGSAADAVTLRAVTVGGTTQFNLGDGNNVFTLGTAPAATATFNGTFGLAEGNGNNTVTVVEGMTVRGDMQLTFGNGNNAYTVATIGHRPVINGNFFLTAGNGNNTITLFGNALGGSIGGNITLNLGNGNDFVTVTGAPSGTLDYTAGGGTDTLNLLDLAAQNWNVDLAFGGGSDTLNAISVPGSELLGTIEAGPHTTADTFNMVGFTLNPSIQLINFP